MRQKVILTSLSPQLFLYQEKPPFYVGGLYYESMTRMSSRQTHLLKGENLLLIIIVILNSLRFHHLGSLDRNILRSAHLQSFLSRNLDLFLLRFQLMDGESQF